MNLGGSRLFRAVTVAFRFRARMSLGLVKGQLPGRELRESLAGSKAQTPNANILFHLPGNIRTTPRPAAVHYQLLLLDCTFTTCSFLYFLDHLCPPLLPYVLLSAVLAITGQRSKQP